MPEVRLLVFVHPAIYELIQEGDEATDGGDYLELPLGGQTFLEVRAE